MRGVSQLVLALQAEVSARHLSFLETGRAEPSREMVLRLTTVLEVPLRERNTLLQAAGFAPVYRETPLEADEMRQVRRAIDCILKGFGHNPAVVLNHRYDILLGNPAATALLRALLPPEAIDRAPKNLIQLMFGRDYLRPAIENWDEVAQAISHRVQREALTASARSGLRTVVEAFAKPDLPRSVRIPDLTKAAEVVIPVRFRRGSLNISLFSTITTLGTPLDITLQEMRIEASFPADPESDEALRKIVAQ